MSGIVPRHLFFRLFLVSVGVGVAGSGTVLTANTELSCIEGQLCVCLPDSFIHRQNRPGKLKNVKIDYLRFSITDRCNLNCIYCTPLQKAGFLAHGDVLRHEEMRRVVELFVKSGIKRVQTHRSFI